MFQKSSYSLFYIKIILGFDQTTWFDSNRGCVLLQTIWFDPIHGCVLLQTTWFDPIHGCVLPQTTWFDPIREYVYLQTTWFGSIHGCVLLQTTWFDQNRSSVSPQTTWFDPNRGSVSLQTIGLNQIRARFHAKPLGLETQRRRKQKNRSPHDGCRVSSCNGPAFHFSLLSSRTPSRPCRPLGRCGNRPSVGGWRSQRER